jgi:Flp pilus assembly protein TadG
MLVLFAAVLPIIILFCGLTLDVGMLELKKLQMQTAADAAALGAEMEAERGSNSAQVKAIGIADAGINGFTNGSNNVTVTLPQFPDYPTYPTSGAYAGRWDAFEATVTQSVSTIFLGALNGGSVTLSAQASALLTPCVYLTGTGTLQQYTLDVATGSLNGDSCPVYVNTSLRVQAAGKMAVEAIGVAGAAADSVLSGSVVYPPPNFNIPTTADPLAYVAQPPYTGCVHNSGYTVSNNPSATLSPTSYCNGLTISNSTVTLSPGTYFITGVVSWTNSNVTGIGVTLFFTHDAGNVYRGITISNSTVNLSAPTDVSNPYQGIVVYADRAWVPHATQDFQIYHSDVTTDGIWYLTGAGLEVTSCLPATAASNNCTMTGNNYFGVIADNMLLTGTIFNPRNDYSNLATGNPLRTLGALVQ